MPFLILMFAIAVAIAVYKYIRYNETTYRAVTGKNYISVLLDKGDYGEYLTYMKLRKYEKDGAKFLFNVYLPKDDGGTTEIDVLMISESGLYVFESKNYGGWIFGNEKSKTWTQSLPNGRRSRKIHFLNPIMQNRLHIKWLNNILDNQDIPVHSIIVFSERCELKKVQVQSSDIKVVKRDVISWVVRAINKSKAGAISKEKVKEIYEKLYPYTQVSDEAKQKHIDDINAKLAGEIDSQEEMEIASVDTESTLEEKTKQEPVDLVCPKCGSPLVQRVAKKGENKGNEFYACSAYPKCRYIQK